MDKQQFCEVLRMHIAKKHRRQAAAARAWGVSESFVSQVLSGKKLPTDAMLADAGYKQVQTEVKYIKIKGK
jgi:predicted XRE-type DNA-binding protein